MIELSKDLKLPIDAMTQTVAILAKRRAGKSFTARRFAEQIAKAEQQIIIVDPKGDWYGIRSSADGKSAGFPVTILGGEHGDVPLEPTGGELVAKLAVEQRVSILVDLSMLRKGQIPVFMAPFLETLYRLKAVEQYRTPVMLFIDEADAIAPQKPFKGEERMLGAAEDIVRRGGQRGLGCMLITQRSAVLNKNVLTQSEILVALRTIAPQDLAAMEAWFEKHGTMEQREILMESLPSLPIGDAWFWSPGWPTESGIFKRIHVSPIETFDSGATPKVGERRIEPKVAAKVDLDSLRKQMAETIERVKANDPKELRRENEDLRRQLAAKAKSPSAPAPDPAAIENARTKAVAQFKYSLAKEMKAYERGIGKLIADARALVGKLAEDAGKFLEGTKELKLTLPSLDGIALVEEKPPVPMPARPVRTQTTEPARAPRGPAPVRTESDSPLPRGEVAILTAACQYANGVSKSQLAVLTGYKRSSRDAYIQRLREKGLIVQSGDRIVPVDGAREHLGSDFEPLPTGAALRDHWLRELPEGERAIFEILIAAHGHPVDKATLDERTGYKRSSRDAYIQRLRAKELVDDDRGTVWASRELF